MQMRTSASARCASVDTRRAAIRAAIPVPLRAEMKRTTSSDRPGGSVSDSMSVTKPAL
jgi:hypothetical protein